MTVPVPSGDRLVGTGDRLLYGTIGRKIIATDRAMGLSVAGKFTLEGCLSAARFSCGAIVTIHALKSGSAVTLLSDLPL